MAGEKLIDMLKAESARGETPEGEDLGACASRPVTKWMQAVHVKRGKLGVQSFC